MPFRLNRAAKFTATVAASLLLTMFSACGGGSRETAAATPPSVQPFADDAMRDGLVGVTVGVVQPHQTLQGDAGQRRLGTADKLRADDDFLIGSNGKAFTAALAGRLVEQGRITWTTTLAEALPDLAAGMLPAYRNVTLEQLLEHRGGLPAFTGAEDIDGFVGYLTQYDGDLPTNLAARERFFATWLLAHQPPAGITPGRDFRYSNAGYALAGLMLEAAGGRPFAELLATELAQPLGIQTSWTAADAPLTQRPAGHKGDDKTKLQLVEPDTADLAGWLDVLRPAGPGFTIRAADYAAWLRWHLRALSGERTPLGAGYIDRLRDLPAGAYRMGWLGADVDGRPVLAHDGEYAGFTSFAVIDRKGRSASYALTNTAAPQTGWVLVLLNKTLLAIERRFATS